MKNLQLIFITLILITATAGGMTTVLAPNPSTYVSCDKPGCTYRCQNDKTLIKAHQEAHKEADGAIYYCNIRGCKDWFYKASDLKSHERKQHTKILLLKRVNKKIEKEAIPPSNVMPYKLFCALEAKIDSRFTQMGTDSPSAFAKKRVSFQKMCKCCQQPVDQHSHKKHVLKNHPEWYDFNHFTLTKNLQTDLHQPNS